MAVPSYDVDLDDINLAEDVTPWDELDDWGGAAAADDETDYYIQGSQCISAQPAKTGAQEPSSQVVDYGSNLAAHFTSGRTCVFVWQIYQPANALDTYDNGGMRVAVAENLGNFSAWKTGGNDFGRNPYGGWQNVVVYPSYPYDYLDDGATGNQGVYQWFGSGLYPTAIPSKGTPFATDAIRYGRGDYRIEFGTGVNPCTFTEMASTNDIGTNRWGLFQEQAGAYLWKGLISLGTSANPVHFVDSNQNISVDITDRTYESFNKIEIKDVDSVVDWTGISIASLDKTSLSTGKLEVIDDADVNMDTCTFTDMNSFIFKSNSTINNTTFRRCGPVKQGSGVFDGCIFENSTAAVSLSANDLDLIDNCNFFSDGSNHGIEISPAHTRGSVTLQGCIFTDYASVSGSTGNESIYNNSGTFIKIYIVDGDFPTIRNGVSSTTQVILASTYTLTGLVSGSEINFVRQDDGSTLYHVESANEDDGTGRGRYKAVYSYSYVSDIPIYIYIHHLEYDWMNITDTLTDTNKITPVDQKLDRWYSNP